VGFVMKHRLTIMILELGAMMLGNLDKDEVAKIDGMLAGMEGVEAVCKKVGGDLLSDRDSWVVMACVWMLNAKRMLQMDV
jgi:hypothetical protein